MMMITVTDDPRAGVTLSGTHWQAAAQVTLPGPGRPVTVLRTRSLGPAASEAFTVPGLELHGNLTRVELASWTHWIHSAASISKLLR